MNDECQTDGKNIWWLGCQTSLQLHWDSDQSIGRCQWWGWHSWGCGDLVTCGDIMWPLRMLPSQAHIPITLTEKYWNIPGKYNWIWNWHRYFYHGQKLLSGASWKKHKELLSKTNCSTSCIKIIRARLNADVVVITKKQHSSNLITT